MSSKPPRLRDVIDHVDIPPLRAFAEHQLAGGLSRAEVIDDVIALVDACIPWDVILPGPVGITAELVDGPLARAIAAMVVAGVVAAQKARARREATLA